MRWSWKIGEFAGIGVFMHATFLLLIAFVLFGNIVAGGGLLAGCLVWLNAYSPATQVLAVEPTGAASMAAALDAGRPTTLARIDTFVDGAAVRRAGDITYGVLSMESYVWGLDNAASPVQKAAA